MTLPAPVANRIGKLIRMLGSDKDGEVLGAACAIKRTLESAGSDLHDLAAKLAGSNRPRPPLAPNANDDPDTWDWGPSPERKVSKPWRWQALRSYFGEHVMALDKIRTLPLSAWERQFVNSIEDRLHSNSYATLSARQIELLNNLLYRAWRAENERR
jgi:hypothetical protein